MTAPLAVILEGTVEADCPKVEADELRDNSDEIGKELHVLGYRTEVVTLTLDVEKARRELEQHKPNVVFNLVDSIEGKGNLVTIAPMLLSHMGLAYTGANAIATSTTCDKLVSKQILRGEGIATASWLTEAEIEQGGEELEVPYILKSNTEHASFGMFADSVVSDRATLKSRWQEKKLKYGSDWFAEAYLEGREFNIALLATEVPPYVRALHPAEIVFTADFPSDKPRIIDYAAKWYAHTKEYIGTQRSFAFGPKDAPILAALKEIGIACWETFGLTGYARVDYRVDAQGVPYVIDVNCNPFLTKDEGLGAAAKHLGISFTEVIRHIVADAYRRSRLPLPEMLAA